MVLISSPPTYAGWSRCQQVVPLGITCYFFDLIVRVLPELIHAESRVAVVYQERATAAASACVHRETVVAVPSRFSVCQLRNTDDGRAGLYRVGDRFMGSRIRAIWNGRVLVGDAEHPEYIGPGECGADPSPATYLPVSDGPLPVLDATSPQG